MPAGASENFLFCAVEIDSLLLSLFAWFLHVRRTTTRRVFRCRY